MRVWNVKNISKIKNHKMILINSNQEIDSSNAHNAKNGLNLIISSVICIVSVIISFAFFADLNGLISLVKVYEFK